MKAFRLASFALVLLLASQVHARPNVIDEWVRLPLPTDQSWRFVGRFGVAIDGDWALVSAFNFGDNGEGSGWDAAALLYHYTGGAWRYQGTLGGTEFVSEWSRPGIAMKDGVAVVALAGMRIFELNNGAWTESPYTLPRSERLAGEDIEIDGGRILISYQSSNYDLFVLRKMNGTWSVEGELHGHGNMSNSENPETPKIDLQGERAVVINNWYDLTDYHPATLRRYRLNENGMGWREQSWYADPEEFRIGPDVAMSGEYTAFTDRRNFGTRVIYDHDNGGQLAPLGLQPADGYMQPSWKSASGIERVRGMFATRNYSYDRRAYVWNLFQMNDDTARTAQHVFTLQTGNGESLGGWIDASGNRVIVSGQYDGVGSENLLSNTVRIYQLPASYDAATTQTFGFENFNIPAGWQTSPGSHFGVYRVHDEGVLVQSTTDGAPYAWLTTTRRTTQSIQSDITVRRVAGADRWVGLFTRRTDEANYYYVTLRTNGRIELKRMRNGVFTTLASAPATLTVGTKVRLRLESIGGTHRVFLDDRQVLTAHDFTLREGAPGVMTNRVAADFDNVIAGPAPLATIYADDFSTPTTSGWSATEGSWQRTGGLVRQSYAAGYARMTVGARTGDQVVQVRVKPTSFTEPDNWVGLLLRYKDVRNHAYLSLRGRGVISLWRRTNGAIEQLATRSIPVTTGAWYTLRVETVAGETRVFVNGVRQFTTTADLGPTDPDVTGQQGSVGVITQKSTADFDDFLAYQP